jgi:DNA polymerase III epsilon subunit-like protein
MTPIIQEIIMTSYTFGKPRTPNKQEIKSATEHPFESNTRQLVLDTETTGFSPENGDRLVGIGIIELISRKFTGKRQQNLRLGSH